MIAKHSILKMVQHIVRRSEGYSDRRIMHPARDWCIGLCAAALLFLGSSAAAGHLFWSKSHTAPDAYEVTIDPVKYDPKLIARVLTEYRRRAAQYTSLHGNSGAVPDGVLQATTTAASTEKMQSEKVVPVAKDAPLRVE
jgi:hypothetical protein